MSGLAPRLPITITLLTDMTTNLLVRLRPLPVIGQGVLRFVFIHRANFFPRGPYTSNRRAVRRFLDARAERAAGRARAKAARMGWRGVLAQRTPPMRAAAKRRRRRVKVGLRDGREWRSLRSLSGRLIAERRVELSLAGGASRSTLASSLSEARRAFHVGTLGIWCRLGEGQAESAQRAR